MNIIYIYCIWPNKHGFHVKFIEVPFLADGHWKPSGTWKLSAGKWFSDEAEDQGIQTAEDSRFFGLSAGFESFSNAGVEMFWDVLGGMHDVPFWRKTGFKSF